MSVVIALLIFVALGLHSNPSDKDLSLSKYIRLMRLVFCISIALFIPAIVEYISLKVSKYSHFILQPIFMYVVGTIFSIGLQLLAYGKLSND